MAPQSKYSSSQGDRADSPLRSIPVLGRLTAAAVRPWLVGIFAVSMLATAMQMLWPGMLSKPGNRFWKPIVLHPEVYLPRMNRNLYALDAPIGGSTVWVGGERGFLAQSNDGGINWTCFTFETSDGTLDKPHPCNPDAAAGTSASATLQLDYRLGNLFPRLWRQELPKVYAAQQQGPSSPASASQLPRPQSNQPNPAANSKQVILPQVAPTNGASQNVSNPIAVSDAAHQYGAVAIGNYDDFPITIRARIPSTRIEIGNFVFDGGPKGPFKLAGNQSCTVEDGDTCVVHIIFQPDRLGPATDQLSFTAGLPAQPSGGIPIFKTVIHLSGTGELPPNEGKPPGPEKTPNSTSASSASTSGVAGKSTAVTYTAGDIVHLETGKNLGLLVIVENGTPRLLSYDGSAWVEPKKSTLHPPNLTLTDPNAPAAYVNAATRCPKVQVTATTTFEQMVEASLSQWKSGDTNCYLVDNAPGVHVNAISYDTSRHRGWAVGGIHGAGAVMRIDPVPLFEGISDYKLTPVTYAAATVPALFPFGMALPAPWFYVALSFCLLLLVGAIFGPRSSEAEGISGTAVSDKPLEPDDVDSMSLRTVADGISRFFRNPNTKAPLVLCINGSWGWGKSSLMNLLADDLQHNVRDRHRVLFFNAWHHQSEDQILASLLQLVRIKALEAPWTPRGLFSRIMIFIKRWPERWFVSIIFCASTVWTFYMAFALMEKGGIDFSKLAAFLPAFVTTLVTLRQLIAGATGFLANPASLLATSSSSDKGQLEAQTTLRERFAKDFKTVTEVLGNGRLVSSH